MKKEITQRETERFADYVGNDKAAQIAMHAVVQNGIKAASVNHDTVRNMRHAFSLTIETGDITNQKRSGRCWMFAALNVMRLEIMEKLNLKTIELSQNYPLFWDKFEKSNYFLENILETMEEPLEGRLMHFLLAAPVADGGQWDMFASLIEKYGVVPKDAMPESAVSSATVDLNGFLTCKLREFASILRQDHAAGKSMKTLREQKEGMMETVYRMLCISLGTPPERFTFETRDKNKKFIRISDCTPVDFYREYVGMDMEDYVSLINAPTIDKPYGKMYTVKYLGNVMGGRPVRYLNLTSDELKNAAISQMKEGKTVWFGSDVGKSSVRNTGIMDLEAFDVGLLYGTEFCMNKAQRLDYGESLMTHAMVLTGVNLEENDRPSRWRVENSWGKDSGKDGYYVMSDQWFDEFTYQIVVHKKHLTEEQRKMLDQDPIELAPWDPMGSLAY